MTLTVVASPAIVRILDGTEVVASHSRSHDRHQQVGGHIRALAAHKSKVPALPQRDGADGAAATRRDCVRHRGLFQRRKHSYLRLCVVTTSFYV